MLYDVYTNYFLGLIFMFEVSKSNSDELVKFLSSIKTILENKF